MRRTTWVPGVLLYVVLSLAQLGHRDLINDEMYTVAATQRLGETLVETHGTMALYYVLLWPWARVSGSAVWLHVPSAVAMALSLVFLALVVERWAGPSAARWAGVYAASSFVIVRFGVEARSYAVWTLTVAMAWYYLVRSIDDPQGRSRWAFAACVLAMPFLHGLSGLVLVGYLISIGWARPSRQLMVSLGLPSLMALGAIGMLWVSGADQVGTTHPPTGLNSLRLFVRGLVFPGVRPAAALLVIALVGAWLMARGADDSPAARLCQVGLLVWGPGVALALLALSLLRPSLANRYAIPSALGLAGLLAVATTHLVKPRWTRLAPPLLALLILAGQTELRLPNHQWSAATSYVSERAQPGDRIAFAPADTRLAFEASLADRPRATVPKLVGTGSALGTFDRFGSHEDADATLAAVGRGKRLWLVSIRATMSPNSGMVEDLLEAFTTRGQFRIVTRTVINDVTIWRLDRTT